MPKDDPGTAATYVDAVLVLDTRAEAAGLGLRDTGRWERCLLFRAEGAYVQVRVPPAPAEGGAPLWIHGQYVPTHGETEPGASPRVSVALVGSRGEGSGTVVGGDGIFALPCDPAVPFWLEFRSGPGPVVRARFEP
jgi:hypothetical protein